MARYLSPEWFEEVNAAAQHCQSAEASQPARLTLQQVVIGGPDGEVRYWVSLDSGKIATGLGEAETPDATVSQSYDTAVALVTGQLRLQTALMSGEIRLTGNIAALMDHQDALQGLDAALSDLRGRTSYR